MGTQPGSGALLKVTALAILLVAACGGGGNQSAAGHSPVATPSASSSSAPATPSAGASQTPAPEPVQGAYGILFDVSIRTAYSVTLVGIDGKVVATASAAIVSQPSCGGVAAAPQPSPISASNSRVYFMDSDGLIRFLAP